jgi:ribosomal protein S18 acetylase RimI-like enzyme
LDRRAIFWVSYEMQIRRADKQNTAELDSVFRIQQSAYALEAKILGLNTDDFFPLRETIRNIQNSTEEIWVHLRSDVVNGAIFLENLEEYRVISKLVVDPIFFRQGIAKSLIQHCLNLYPKSEFHVGTGAFNQPAILLYESFNFKVFQEDIVEPNLKIVKLKRTPDE